MGEALATLYPRAEDVATQMLAALAGPLVTDAAPVPPAPGATEEKS